MSRTVIAEHVIHLHNTNKRASEVSQKALAMNRRKLKRTRIAHQITASERRKNFSRTTYRSQKRTQFLHDFEHTPLTLPFLLAVEAVEQVAALQNADEVEWRKRSGIRTGRSRGG